MKQNLTELKKHYAEMGEEIKRLENPEGRRWKPEAGERYWMDFGGKDQRMSVWDNTPYDTEYFAESRVHRSEEASEASYLAKTEYIALLDEIWPFQRDFVPNWEDRDEYRFYLRIYGGRWSWIGDVGVRHNNWPVFRTQEDAKACIKALGSKLDRLLVLPW